MDHSDNLHVPSRYRLPEERPDLTPDFSGDRDLNDDRVFQHRSLSRFFNGYNFDLYGVLCLDRRVGSGYGLDV